MPLLVGNQSSGEKFRFHTGPCVDDFKGRVLSGGIFIVFSLLSCLVIEFDATGGGSLHHLHRFRLT